MLAATMAGWVIWAYTWGLAEVALSTAWGGVLAIAALAIHGGRLNFRDRAQVPGWVAALMLAGIPGSALWRAATVLGGQAWLREAYWLMAVAAIGMMVTTAYLLEWIVPEQHEPYPRSRWTGAILLSALSIPLIGVLWGIRVPDLGGGSVSSGPLAAQLALPVLGYAGGILLWQNRGSFRSLRPLLDAVAMSFSFVWFWRFVGRAGWLLLSGLRGMALVLEGENYAWLVLFLLLTLVLLLPG
jgi:hypothetical protein